MAVLTASFKGAFETRDTNVTRYPASSGLAVYKNAWYGLSTGGYLVATSSGNTQGVFVIDPLIPSSGKTTTAAGVVSNVDANTFLAIDRGYITYTCSGLSQADVGTSVYALNNGTLVATSSTGKVKVGTLTQYISATKGEVLLERNCCYVFDWEGEGQDFD